MSHDVTFRSIAGFRVISADPRALAAFYRAIGFTVGEPAPIGAAEMTLLGLAGAGARIPMSLGPSHVAIESFEQPGQPYPAGASACDLFFQHLALVTNDAEAAWQLARGAGATPISRDGPIKLPRSAGGVTAIKFRDPEGHPLEFLQFPLGANRDWRGTGIMGIDHSAISVSDIAASRRFYAFQGLVEGKPTLNRGPTQVALDGLDDVEVDVLPMNPVTASPHLELLGYRHPIGQPHPPLVAKDIAATRIVWRSNREALIRDLDGHLHQFSR